MAEQRRFMGPALPVLAVRAGISPGDAQITLDGVTLTHVKSLAFTMEAGEPTVVRMEMYCELDVSAEFSRVLETEPRRRYRRTAEGAREPIPESER